MTERFPVLFLGHGSPMTVISDVPERRAFQALGPALPRPRAILVVSAHWETRGATHLTAGANPRTIHDFRGFPDELYAINYAAPGADWLLDRIGELMGEVRILRDSDWGFDHGAWGVVQPMYPDADIPLVEMSIDRNLRFEEHLAVGELLAPLRDEGVLIIGSGNIIHNLSLWRQTAGTVPDWAAEFRERLNAAILADDRAALTSFAPDDRAAALAINAAEHYLPLLYVIGARLPGDDAAIFNDTLDGSLSMTSVFLGDTRMIAKVV